jgi:4-hydroxy-tetrahydrodipicolinate synthase
MSKRIREGRHRSYPVQGRLVDTQPSSRLVRAAVTESVGSLARITTGELAASRERAHMPLDELVAAGINASRMMPGTGCCSIMETVKLTAQAVEHGCAGVLMLPPFYYKDVSEEGLYRYFSEVVQRVGDARLKIYLYHIPPVAVVGITTVLVERLLAAYHAIAGMKDVRAIGTNTS